MPTLTERVNNLEINITKTNGKLDLTLKHLVEEIKNNTKSISKLKESYHKQNTTLQQITHTLHSDKKLIAVLMTFIGGVIGYIVKIILEI